MKVKYRKCLQIRILFLLDKIKIYHLLYMIHTYILEANLSWLIMLEYINELKYYKDNEL